MSFNEIPENKQESYPCDCGGNIVRRDENTFECDSCDKTFPICKRDKHE